MTRLQALRSRAFIRQKERCHYCGLPMWQVDVRSFACRYGISVPQARAFQCTAEHLLARCEGGKNVTSNVVASCRHCNLTRHRRKRVPDPKRWQQTQRSRAQRRWQVCRGATA